MIHSRRNMPVKKPILVAVSLAAILYLGLVSSQYFAYYITQSPRLERLQIASQLEPWNAAHQYKMGQLLFMLQRYPEAAKAFMRAVKLNPHQARYWLGVASVEFDPLLIHSQRQAIGFAVAADPKSPRFLWEAANISLSQGDLNSGFHYFRSVLEGDPSLAGQVIQIIWHTRPDVDTLLEQALPRNDSGIYSVLLSFLLSQKETASAARAWSQIVTLGKPVNRSDVFDYIQYLIGQQQQAKALEVWENAGPLCDLNNYQPSPSNLIVNGDFNFKILNRGFDWVYEKRSGVTLEIDPTQPHMGLHPLRISYDSSGLDDSGIHQLIPLQGRTRYHFSAFVKTLNLEGAGGPRFLLQDFYSGKPYFETSEIHDSDGWTPLVGEFETGSQAGLSILQVPRTPAGAAIRGKLWIDGVRLSPVSEIKVQ